MLQQLRVPKSLDKRRGGVSRFSVKIFLSHSVENFHRGILYCCINFRWRKSLWRRGGKEVSRFSIRNFLSHSAENLRREFFTVALFSGTEKVWIEGGGGVSRFSVKIFLSHSVENFHRGILYCCIDFRWRKSLWTRRGKEVSRFAIEKFFSHTAENLRRESFAVGLISGTQKTWIRGVSIKTFGQKCFLSHSAESFPREYFIVAIISRTEKVWRRGGGGVSRFSVKNFCLTLLPKISVRNTFLLH